MRSMTPLFVALLSLTVFAWGEDRIGGGGELALTGSSIEPQAALDSDQAHWRRGDVRIDQAWVHYSQVGELAHRTSQLQRYRELRSDRGSSIDDQLNLADECRKLQLLDEERAHLEQVIRQNPNHAAARQRLGDRQFEGSWLTRRDQQQLRSRLANLASAEKRYGAEIRTAAKQLNDSKQRRREAAEQVLNGIHDPAAIPLMEQAFAYSSEASQIGYLKWLDRVPSWKSSAAMARLSLTSDSPRVRVETAKRLSERPWEEFVPVYMSEMSTPAEMKSELVRFGPWAKLTMVETSETADSKRTKVIISRFSPTLVNTISFRGQFSTWDLEDAWLNSLQAGIHGLEILAWRENDYVSQENLIQELRNDQVCRLLSNSLEIYGSHSPTDWWRWWNAAQGYTDVEKRQVLANYEESWLITPRGRERTNRPPVQRVVCSCFVAGTLVQSESGPVPIESIQVGDRVLSQDVETGELAFKPVLRTTVRESKDTCVIQAGSDKLQCTPGHPFWVKGQGWVQAHNLTEQSQLHTINGAAANTQVKEDLGATVHNLEVADFNTYFVGREQILSHDVTVRDPTDMVEPGTVKPELAAYNSP